MHPQNKVTFFSLYFAVQQKCRIFEVQNLVHQQKRKNMQVSIEVSSELPIRTITFPSLDTVTEEMFQAGCETTNTTFA